MINWKWPQTKQNNFLPWYVMLKNLPALPFMLLAFVFGTSYAICMGIAYFIVKGPTFAWDFVKEEIQGSSIF